MAYKVPELTLVGAAQNIVLQDSAPQPLKGVGECPGFEEPPSNIVYDVGENW